MTKSDKELLRNALTAYQAGVQPSREEQEAVENLLIEFLEKRSPGRPRLTPEELRKKLDGPLEVEMAVLSCMTYSEARDRVAEKYGTTTRALQHYKRVGAHLRTVAQPVPMSSWGLVGLVLAGSRNPLAETHGAPC